MQAAVSEVWGTRQSRELQGRGAGGDGTVYIDSLAEQTVLRLLEQEHRRGRDFQLVSEEVGERSYGTGGDVVVVDPIDGSHNAKMGVPYFSLVLAAASGTDYGAVREAAIRNLVTGEHYEAVRGAGATRNGATLGGGGADGRIAIVQLEATAWPENYPRFAPLVEAGEKLRILGSAALNICLCATGAVSVSAAPTLRSVDCAGPLLVLSEAGGVATDLDGNPLDRSPLDVTTRVPVLAACGPEVHSRALELVARRA